MTPSSPPSSWETSRRLRRWPRRAGKSPHRSRVGKRITNNYSSWAKASRLTPITSMFRKALFSPKRRPSNWRSPRDTSTWRDGLWSTKSSQVLRSFTQRSSNNKSISSNCSSTAECRRSSRQTCHKNPVAGTMIAKLCSRWPMLKSCRCYWPRCPRNNCRKSLRRINLALC